MGAGWDTGGWEVLRPAYHLMRAFWFHVKLAPPSPLPFKKPSSFLSSPFNPLLESLQGGCCAITGKDSVPVLLRNHESACWREGGGGEEISFYDEPSHTSCCFCFGHTDSEAVGCSLPAFWEYENCSFPRSMLGSPTCPDTRCQYPTPFPRQNKRDDASSPFGAWCSSGGLGQEKALADLCRVPVQQRCRGFLRHSLLWEAVVQSDPVG